MALALVLLIPLAVLLLLLFTAGPEKTATLVGEPQISPSTKQIDAVLGVARHVQLYRLDPGYEGHRAVLVSAVTMPSGREFVSVNAVGHPPMVPLWVTRGTADPGAALSDKGYLVEGTPEHEASSSNRAAGALVVGIGALVLAAAIVLSIALAH